MELEVISPLMNRKNGLKRCEARTLSKYNLAGTAQIETRRTKTALPGEPSQQPDGIILQSFPSGPPARTAITIETGHGNRNGTCESIGGDDLVCAKALLRGHIFSMRRF